MARSGSSLAGNKSASSSFSLLVPYVLRRFALGAVYTYMTNLLGNTCFWKEDITLEPGGTRTRILSQASI